MRGGRASSTSHHTCWSAHRRVVREPTARPPSTRSGSHRASSAGSAHARNTRSGGASSRRLMRTHRWNSVPDGALVDGWSPNGGPFSSNHLPRARSQADYDVDGATGRSVPRSSDRGCPGHDGTVVPTMSRSASSGRGASIDVPERYASLRRLHLRPSAGRYRSVGREDADRWGGESTLLRVIARSVPPC